MPEQITEPKEPFERTEEVKETINLQQLLLWQMRDIDRMIVQPFPNDSQFCRAIEIFKSKLLPYADERFKFEFNALNEKRRRSMIRAGKNRRAADGITVNYYLEVYTLTQFLFKRINLGLRTVGTADFIGYRDWLRNKARARGSRKHIH